jgi:hypothetical protein
MGMYKRAVTRTHQILCIRCGRIFKMIDKPTATIGIGFRTFFICRLNLPARAWLGVVQRSLHQDAQSSTEVAQLSPATAGQ